MTDALPFPPRDEIVEFDRAVLSALCQERGTEAEAFLTARLTELSALMERAAAAWAAADMCRLELCAAAISAASVRIGMRTMTAAADAVRAASRAGDAVALAACTERMLRLGRLEAVRRWTVRQGTVA